MPEAAAPAPPQYPARRIFVLSSMALFAAGLSFSLRMGIIAAIQQEILVTIDPARAGELAGSLLGIAFSGFAFTLLLGSRSRKPCGRGL